MSDNTLLRHIAALLHGMVQSTVMPESVRCVLTAIMVLLSGMYSVLALKRAFSSSGR